VSLAAEDGSAESESERRRGPRRKRLAAALTAIIAFKGLKAAAFVIVGVVLLRFVHVTKHAAPLEFARYLNVPSDWATIRRLSGFFDTFTSGQREAIGAAALAIGAIFAGEGSLLLGRVWWATYFTIFMTLAAIPLEVMEIWKRPQLFRGWVSLLINVAILVFLWRRRNEFRMRINAPRRSAAR
jgi:uncharacterized membrane protein (DUF2068 family)